MPKRSAGLLLYRRDPDLEVFLVHPGGPFWAKKDAGAWSIPKGEYEEGEDTLTAARREFFEETGISISEEAIALGEEKQPGGKLVTIWAVEKNIDPDGLKSNTFPLEWPPRSGKMVEVPEIDRWEWFSMEQSAEKILRGQKTFLDRLAEKLV